jgi:hypothetical protein
MHDGAVRDPDTSDAHISDEIVRRRERLRPRYQLRIRRCIEMCAPAHIHVAAIALAVRRDRIRTEAIARTAALTERAMASRRMKKHAARDDVRSGWRWTEAPTAVAVARQKWGRPAVCHLALASS